MQPDLIYDVGVNDGTDTAYYLSRGFRVVGVECSPVLVEKLRERFRQEIADGRLVLLDVGVASENGDMEFWMSDQHEWSSFDRAIASRNGTPHRAVMVRTRRFSEVLAEQGVPLFCKIDIEGHDRLCLEGMTRETAPRSLSIEMNHASGDQDIELLRDLGYTRFKIVSQVTLHQSNPLLTYLGYALPKRLGRVVQRTARKLFGVERVGDWEFKHGSSGAFAEDTPGPWHDANWALRRWRFLHDLDRRFAAKGLGDWFDVHAARD
jgi:FkbM family methyltransferase